MKTYTENGLKELLGAERAEDALAAQKELASLRGGRPGPIMDAWGEYGPKAVRLTIVGTPCDEWIQVTI